jgi:uncharacterized protein
MRRFLKIATAGFFLASLSIASMSKDTPSLFLEMEVKGVAVDPVGQTPVVLLADKEGNRALPIWIGPVEAHAIDMELNTRSSPRPMTHDLLHHIISRMKMKVKEIRITDFKNSTYYATLLLSFENGEMEVDSRPSDAIILALKSKAPILISRTLLEQQGVPLPTRNGFAERQGLRVQELTPALASQFNFKGTGGVLVSEVVAGSPSEASGIKAGDIILRVDDREIGGVKDFARAFDETGGSTQAKLSVFRDDQFLDMTFSLNP